MSSTSFQRSSFSFPFVFFWAAGGVFDDGPGAERRQLGVQRADVGGQDARLRAPHPQNADRAQTERCSVRFSFVFFWFFFRLGSPLFVEWRAAFVKRFVDNQRTSVSFLLFSV